MIERFTTKVRVLGVGASDHPSTSVVSVSILGREKISLIRERTLGKLDDKARRLVFTLVKYRCDKLCKHEEPFSYG